MESSKKLTFSFSILIIHCPDSTQQYYSDFITTDFVGWRFYYWPLRQIPTTRTPLGWNNIKRVQWSATWGTTPVDGTVVCFDNMELIGNQVSFVNQTSFNYNVPTHYSQLLTLTLQNELSQNNEYYITATNTNPTYFGASVTSSLIIPGMESSDKNQNNHIKFLNSFSDFLIASSTGTIVLNITSYENAPLQAWTNITLSVSSALTPGTVLVSFPVIVTVTEKHVTTKSRPFLLIDNSMKASFEAVPYKQTIIQKFITDANAILTKDLTVPHKWGAWSGKKEKSTNIPLNREIMKNIY